MTTELPKTYDPSSAQSRWIEHWESHGYCNADPHPDKPSHTIYDSAAERHRRAAHGALSQRNRAGPVDSMETQQGHEALWMPGTDHAGIATQAVVERRMLEEEGLTRRNIGRDALVERIWKWERPV